MRQVTEENFQISLIGYIFWKRHLCRARLIGFRVGWKIMNKNKGGISIGKSLLTKITRSPNICMEVTRLVLCCLCYSRNK